ncbi:hypothetical protein CONPUDRAFT_139150 [Coniophora puteana RWD-64-598 SS2]|uniref:Uncharacterized protein n=1 Tax=Coniophora puteana (strain RWD-64-598) TaxID=741705 RepID=A0A5M3MCX6_CONPW|nr:uncharacterized protein CONPUDRAFT_139150 [Coniophora puteana RWD-64-598 SS2]EIW77068.1 hypothetical protein CONPUDRAFT_139150 [Coniophora puteana RWD-64-598 SS2]
MKQSSEKKTAEARSRSPHVHFAQQGNLGTTKESRGRRGKKTPRRTRLEDGGRPKAPATGHETTHQPEQRIYANQTMAAPAPVPNPAPQQRTHATPARSTHGQWWSPNPAFCCAPNKWPAPREQAPNPRTPDPPHHPGLSPYTHPYRSPYAPQTPYAYTPQTPYTPRAPYTPCAQAANAYTLGSPASYAAAPAYIHSPFPFRPVPVLRGPWVGDYGTPAWGGGAAGLAY